MVLTENLSWCMCPVSIEFCKTVERERVSSVRKDRLDGLYLYTE